MMKIAVLLLSLLILSRPGDSSSNGLKFSPMFGDRMVLQRSPARATVWGHGELLPGTEASLDCQGPDGSRKELQTAVPTKEGGSWRVDLPPQEAGTVCDIIVVGGVEEIHLKQVIFGDVWLCSGQSNMEMNMKVIMNSTEEILDSARYTDIRFMIVARATSARADTDDLEVVISQKWADPSDSNKLRHMSAVCFLYARNIQDMMGEFSVPIGLIGSYWGGTPVEAWSSQAALDRSRRSNSQLWNAMINPIKRTALKGFLWYQGEANAGNHKWLSHLHTYNYSFLSLIESWREEFSSASDTSPEAPFGFVQLSTVKFGSMGPGYPVLRWHQTADYGFVPNEEMKDVFMAVAIDTVDSKEGYPGGLHPRYKQIVGERLAIAGMNVAYGQDQFPTNGPWPERKYFNDTDGMIHIQYSEPITYSKEVISGFYFCCETKFEDCDLQFNNFEDIPQDMVFQGGDLFVRIQGLDSWGCGEGGLNPPHLAYLWRQTPYQSSFTAAIYSNNKYNLPAAPWKFPASAFVN